MADVDEAKLKDSLGANLFELEGDGLKVTYSMLGFMLPVRRLTVTENGQDRTFTGGQVRQLTTELGTLVTVTTKILIDAGTTTLTVVLPHVNLGPNHVADIETFAIRTEHRTSIGGPALVHGALELYETVELSGKARAVLTID